METKERQMTIDDYLNNNSVVMMNSAPVEKGVETLEVEPVDYNTLTREELLTILASKDITIKNYEQTISDNEEKHNIEIKNLTEYYTQRQGELSNLVQYYERKLKVLGDIIYLETGGVK